MAVNADEVPSSTITASTWGGIPRTGTAASYHAGEDEVLLPAEAEFQVENVDPESREVDVTLTNTGYDFGSIDVDFIRETMEEEGLSYPEAVEEAV